MFGFLVGSFLCAQVVVRSPRPREASALFPVPLGHVEFVFSGFHMDGWLAGVACKGFSLLLHIGREWIVVGMLVKAYLCIAW